MQSGGGQEGTGDPGQIRYRLLYLLRRGHVAAKLGIDDLARAEGLSASDYTALSFLEAMEPCSTADLARAERVSPQAAVQQVAQLKLKALVTSIPSDSDRRTSSVSLTEEGRRRFASIDRAARELEDAMMADLSPLERGMVLSLLRKLIASAEKLAPAPTEG